MLSQHPSRMSRVIISILVFAVLTAFFLYVSFRRLVAGDEGYYILAAKLVMQGKVPYGDFFYPQMPFMPFAYGIWMKFFGFTWYGARSFTAVIAAIIGLLIFERTKRTLGFYWSLIALVLYLTSSMILPWFTVVKTYGLSTLCLLGAYLFLVEMKWVRPLVRYTVVALLFQLAVSTRLFFAALLPVFIFWILQEERQSDQRRRALGAFLGALLVTSFPYLYLIFTNFDGFIFNNLGYHLMRDDTKALISRESRYKVGGLLFGFRKGDQLVGFQFAILFFLTLLNFVRVVVKRRSIELSSCIALVLILVSFLPAPIYVQYFCTPVPFMIISSLEVVRAIATSYWVVFNRIGKLAMLAAGFILLAEYLRVFPYDLERFTASGKGVIGISGARDAANWRIKTINAIGDYIDEIVTSGEEVISIWPGHIFESKARSVAGLENQFGVQVAKLLSKEKRAIYKIMSKDEIETLIKEKRHRLVVLEEKLASKNYQEALQAGGYALIKRIENTCIYQRS